MRNVFIFFAFLIAGMAHAQIITNVDKLRIRDVEQGLESDKILVIDSDNVVRWIDAIEIDLSDYYTISEVDTFVADLEAGLLERYTKDEVDALLDGLELRLDDYYTKTEADSIITNVNDRIDDIDLNTVTSVDNVTSIKIRGSDIFTNNLESDFAQIADVNKAGFGLISMQSEMKIGLVAKDGTTLLGDVDLSWLASGDLAVTIDDTDPNNPELVFSQNGVEVARIPASTLLSGVARSANLSNYILQFKDGTGAVVYSVNLGPLFEDYFTKAEANARFALRTRTISAGNGLTGGGNLTANRTIALSTDTQDDIAKGVTAHGWGDFRDYGLGGDGVNSVDKSRFSSFIRRTVATTPYQSYGVGINLAYGEASDGTPRGAQMFIENIGNNNTTTIKFRNYFDNQDSVKEIWHTGNLENPATTAQLNSKENAFTKNTAFNKNFGTGSNDVARGNHTHTFASLTNKPTTLSGFGITDGVPNSRTISAGTGLTGGGNLTANRTIALSTTTQNDIGKGVTAHGWGDFRDFGLGSSQARVEDLVDSNIPDNLPSGLYASGVSSNSLNFPRYLAITRGGKSFGILFSNSGNTVGVKSGDGNINLLWHTGNFTPSNYYTKTESLNQFVGLSGVQTINSTKTFTSSPVVPNPTLDAHAVNKEWVEENYKLQLVKIQDVNSIAASSTAFLKVNNINFLEGDIPIIIGADNEEIIIDEGGVYSIQFLGHSIIISGSLTVLINNSQQDSPLLFSGTNEINASGNFVYKLDPNDTIKFSITNKDNQNNQMIYTIVLRKLK